MLWYVISINLVTRSKFPTNLYKWNRKEKKIGKRRKRILVQLKIMLTVPENISFMSWLVDTPRGQINADLHRVFPTVWKQKIPLLANKRKTLKYWPGKNKWRRLSTFVADYWSKQQTLFHIISGAWPNHVLFCFLN